MAAEMNLLQRAHVALHDLVRRNRIKVKAGNVLECGYKERLKMRKVDLHIKGKGNRMVVGKDTMIACCKVRVCGQNQTLVIGERCEYHAGKIYLRYNRNQKIVIGSDASIEDCYLLTDEDASITIGDGVLMSKLVHFRAGDGHSVLDVATGKRINRSRDIVVGDHVWIGRGATLLKGAHVADNSIVGAYAVVTRRYEQIGVAIAGNPARVVREGVTWDRRML